MKRWYTREWTNYEAVKDNDAKVSDVKEALEDAVHRQLMSDVPYGQFRDFSYRQKICSKTY